MEPRRAAVPPTVGVLHPGEMGSAVGAAVRQSGSPTVWCQAGRGPATARRAAAADLQPVDTLEEVVSASAVILSICPPAFAEAVSRQVLDHGFRGIYVEANAISTERAARIARSLDAAGIQVVDGALFSPRRASDNIRCYLAGDAPAVAAVADLFRNDMVTTVTMDGGVGTASALKMAHSSFQKAARPLAALAYALAAASGVSDHLMTEAAGTVSPLAQPERLPTVASKAWRWVPEMEEVAATLTAHGLPADSANAAAALLRRWADHRDDRDKTIDEVLRSLTTPQ